MPKFGTCEVCCLPSDDIHRHHIIPRSRGGNKGPTIKCCPTCTYQIHVLFSNKELSKMGIADLLSSAPMKKYIEWKKKHPGDFKHKLSRRVR